MSGANIDSRRASMENMDFDVSDSLKDCWATDCQKTCLDEGHGLNVANSAAQLDDAHIWVPGPPIHRLVCHTLYPVLLKGAGKVGGGSVTKTI